MTRYYYKFKDNIVYSRTYSINDYEVADGYMYTCTDTDGTVFNNFMEDDEYSMFLNNEIIHTDTDDYTVIISDTKLDNEELNLIANVSKIK